MLSSSPVTAEVAARSVAAAAALAWDDDANRRASQHIAETLVLLQEAFAPQRRLVHTGDVIYGNGDRFDHLYVLNSGFVKIVNLAPDGRELVVGLKFRGDWVGFDGIAGARYTCDAVAMDTGEVWVLHYERLLQVCTRRPELLKLLHQAMSREIARESLARRGMRTDQITLRMTRAEIGNYLGMTLETVSRALSRLARGQLIEFAEKGRRDIRIPQVEALAQFVQRSLTPADQVLQ